MISIRRAADRHRTRDDWLESLHSFAATGCEQPGGEGLSCLVALNETWLEPGAQIGMHSHEHLEIVTFVLDGVLAHSDTIGNQVRMLAGEVQVLSAGDGVSHGERNASRSERLGLIQAWLRPADLEPAPRWQQKYFSEDEKNDAFCLVASADGRDGSLVLRQDAAVFASVVRPPHDQYHRVPAGRVSYLHVAQGALTLNARELGAGDGAVVADEEMHLETAAGAEVLVFDLPAVDASTRG